MATKTRTTSTSTPGRILDDYDGYEATIYEGDDNEGSPAAWIGDLLLMMRSESIGWLLTIFRRLRDVLAFMIAFR